MINSKLDFIKAITSSECTSKLCDTTYPPASFPKKITSVTQTFAQASYFETFAVLIVMIIISMTTPFF